MTKAEHVAKFINELYSDYCDKDGDIGIQEILECGFGDLKEQGYETVTTYNGEVIDVADFDWSYERFNDHMSYHIEIDGQVIGATGWYDSWAGSEIDDPEIKVGRLVTYSYFVKGK